MGAFAEAIAGAFSGLATTGYSLYQDQRDFNYAKDLQQQIFNREDTAVQRRMADLKAAGLNPNLAAGSSAGAGSIVGHSNTDVDFGAALDSAKASQQLKLNSLITKQEEENLKHQKIMNKYDESLKRYDYLDSTRDFWYSRGYTITDTPNLENFGVKSTISEYTGQNPYELKKEYELLNQKNSADIIQGNADWQFIEKILGPLAPIMDALEMFLNYKSKGGKK